ncbi:MAG: hypothetical protein OEY86_17190 [Nitrospira sp.]|nr:hypothetical protein [Nitrospira sp.]
MLDQPPPSLTEALSSDYRQRFYEGHRSLALLMILILLLAPFAGLYVTGLLGAILGVVSSIAAYYLAPLLALVLGR